MSKERVNRLIQVIRKIPLFDGLGPRQIQAVLGACSPRRLEEGEVVCAAETPGDEMYILLSGEAAVYTADETEVDRIRPVATIGEMGIVTKQPRTSTVKAIQASNALVLKRLFLDVALKADVEAQARILRNIVEILAAKMNADTARLRDLRHDLQQQRDAAGQLLRRVDMALALLVKKTGMDAAEARALIDEQLSCAADRRVLVVDDEDHVRRMLCDLLADYDVSTARDGTEALETAMENKPDLVITDIRMPEMDGYALLMKLREFHPDIPVLALSGYALEDDVKQHDFDGFVTKPMQVEEFKNTVAAVLATR